MVSLAKHRKKMIAFIIVYILCKNLHNTLSNYYLAHLKPIVKLKIFCNNNLIKFIRLNVEVFQYMLINSIIMF